MGIKSYQFNISAHEQLEEHINQCTLSPQIAFLFGSKHLLSHALIREKILKRFHSIILCGCTTSGEIIGSEVFDDSLVVTLVQFEKTKIIGKTLSFNSIEQSEEIGAQLSRSLFTNNLKHIFVLSDGLSINGSMLVQGLRDNLPKSVSITGGLAGDGSNFNDTGIISNDGFGSKSVVAVGFYGEDLHIGFGSLGGWDSFGPERKITKSSHNILYELDGKPALTLYKEYLGERASDLPASGLLFPLTIKVPGNSEPLIRTLLGINEEEQSLTFAGDIPQECMARLMKANTHRLLEGASNAASIATLGLNLKQSEFAILISCIGRRLILKQRTEEEIEVAREVLGTDTPTTGFYSYGEIAPFSKGARCELHNQTMTITSFSEE